MTPLLVPLDLTGTLQQALGGSMLLAVPVALVVGLVSFFSPCVVPLLPGYLSFASGLGASDVLEGKGSRGRMLADPRWQNYLRRVDGLIDIQNSRILTPVSYSPLQ